VVDPRRRLLVDEPHDEIGHVDGPRRLADFVGHTAQRLALFGQVAHGPGEALPVGAVQPGGADDEIVVGVAADGPFAGGLGAAVRALRIEQPVLRVGARRLPAEHVVGGDVDETRADRRAAPGQDLRAGGVDREGDVLLRLGGVHGRECGGVDDHVDVPDDLGDAGRIRDVDRVPVDGHEIVSVPENASHEVLTEHAPRTCNQPAHLPANLVWILVRVRITVNRVGPPSRHCTQTGGGPFRLPDNRVTRTGSRPRGSGPCTARPSGPCAPPSGPRRSGPLPHRQRGSHAEDDVGDR